MLGDVVRARREALGWKQTTLAARAGLAQSYISMIENGAAPDVSLATLRKLAAALALPLSTLVTGSSDPEPEPPPPLDDLRALGWSARDLATLAAGWLTDYSPAERREIIRLARELRARQEADDRRRQELGALTQRHQAPS